MIGNYLKTALRNIMRSKGHSIINVFGLSVAMALCILIFLLVRQELSYDGFHENGANVFRVTQTAFMRSIGRSGLRPFPSRRRWKTHMRASSDPSDMPIPDRFW